MNIILHIDGALIDCQLYSILVLKVYEGQCLLWGQPHQDGDYSLPPLASLAALKIDSEGGRREVIQLIATSIVCGDKIIDLTHFLRRLIPADEYGSHRAPFLALLLPTGGVTTPEDVQSAVGSRIESVLIEDGIKGSSVVIRFV